MEKVASSKTIGDSIYSINENGKLTILASGQRLVVYEPSEALELLQWLYAYRELFLSAAYPTGIPDWAQQGRTSQQDTHPYLGQIVKSQRELEQRQKET
jgi:hypothetical protein